ncbi:hypothetical protein DPMN_145023 [Dreissena polymorpha]|uniref:Uncharacterized protein n=1 Tax=Dreissena polymorpha TaxID=45954 RepID=A0A9D4F7V4_DREPO|nr:hypothetical protein DPMN_145023 [Dreissena polymorpha]
MRVLRDLHGRHLTYSGQNLSVRTRLALSFATSVNLTSARPGSYRKHANNLHLRALFLHFCGKESGIHNRPQPYQAISSYATVYY